MWHSFRDLSTAEVYQTDYERDHAAFLPPETRVKRYKERFAECKRYAAFNTIKTMYEEADSFDDKNIVYMSARDFWERFLKDKERKRSSPSTIGLLLNLVAHIYSLDIIRIWDYYPNSKTKDWIKLYPIPTRWGWN